LALGAEADDGGRTRDLKLGKLALYQLSYVRAGGILRRAFGNQRKGDSWEAKELFSLLDEFEMSVRTP